MSSVMYNFLEKYPVEGCNRLLDRISPVEVVSIVKFFPVAGISSKKNTITVTYIVNPKSRFRGKAKTKVEVDRTSSTLRLLAKGDVSFEVRFNCTNDILTVYFVVTGKLIEMIPRDKAKRIFDEIVNYVRMKAFEIGALKPEETPPPPPAAPTPPQPEMQPPQPTPVPQPQPPTVQPAVETAAQPSPAQEEIVQPEAPTAPAEAEAAETAVEQPPSPPPPPPQQPQAAAEAAVEKVAGGLSVTECMARLVTAGLPVDEELSRRIPFEYAPKLSLSPLVEMGEATVDKLDFTRYTDGYMVRLSSGGARLDSLRLEGKVGVYLRVDGSEHLGSEAVWRAVNIYCTDPKKKVFYIVVKV